MEEVFSIRPTQQTAATTGSMDVIDTGLTLTELEQKHDSLLQQLTELDQQVESALLAATGKEKPSAEAGSSS